MNKIITTVGLFLCFIWLNIQVGTAQVRNSRLKVDGVASVVGDFLILESDIDKAFIELQTSGANVSDFTRCQVLGKLMEDKLYAHQAIQDSIEVTDLEIRSMVNRQIEYLANNLGTVQKVVEFYNKEDEESLREELFNLMKINELSTRMKTQIVKDIEVTPDEVRQFFNAIPEQERPVFGTELEIAQIVVKPIAPKEEEQKVIERLNEIKSDVETTGSSFSTKAILYSQDRATGGKTLTFNRSSALDKTFKDVAFSLQEGEISKPFKSEFGWHIIQMDKIRGKEVTVRHILMIPDIPRSALADAKQKIETIRKRIVDGELTFDQAARNFSDEKETRNDGGQLINPEDLSTRFELTRMEPELYEKVAKLKDNEVSVPYIDESRTGQKSYKIYYVTNRHNEHKADFVKDYVKIQDLALKEKQLKIIAKWVDDNIRKTHISVSKSYSDCNFVNDWMKKNNVEK